tara:strand:- start:1117 stop:1578 length:462 start_codon:yes stop_codon:yes gene_type:complete
MIIKATKTFSVTSPSYHLDLSSELTTDNPARTNPGWKITEDILGHPISGAPYEFQFALTNAAPNSSNVPQLHLKFAGANHPVVVHASDSLTTPDQAWSTGRYNQVNSGYMDYTPICCSLVVGVEVIYMVLDRGSAGTPAWGGLATFTVSSILY